MVVMWSFIRTVAFHLQVCWEVVLGPKFMWTAFFFGFGIPAVGLTVMLILTGVSFRFGQICHINVTNGLYDYWIPVMIFASAALFLQVATIAYCTHIYLRSLFDKSASTSGSSGAAALPSYTSSVRTVTARQAYRRMRRVLQLQWRGITLVLIILANVIFFAVVFINLDNAVAPNAHNAETAVPWLRCLTLTKGDMEACREYAAAIGPNEETLLAVVFLLSLVGFWNFILFARPSMFAGWFDLFRSVKRDHEFVSADAAHNRFGDNKGFEMLTTSVKSPDTFGRSPSPSRMAGFSRSPVSSPIPPLSPTYNSNVTVAREARYVRPSLSFSGPRPPSSLHNSRDWDPQSSFAPRYGGERE